MDCRHLIRIICYISILCFFQVCKKHDSIENIWHSLEFVTPEGQSLEHKFWSQKKNVLYFGFSHCPDMCPLALTNFGRASLILGERAKDFQFIFITLDPERDSPQTLRKYIQQFPGQHLTALSPSANTMPILLDSLGIVRKKVDLNGTYSIDHSNFIYVIDREGKLKASYPGGISANALATALRNLNVF